MQTLNGSGMMWKYKIGRLNFNHYKLEIIHTSQRFTC